MKYKPHSCPISQFVSIMGDDWNWLILREAFRGRSRFSEFQRETGIAKNILASRIDGLLNSELLMRKNVGVSGQRYEYFLTEKGKSLKPVLQSILDWSKAHLC